MHQEGFYCISAGWTTKSNCKAGVMICFNKKYYKPDDIKYLNYPTDKHIAGRFLGCRMLHERRRKSDLFFATTYFPPWTGTENKSNVQLQLHLRKVCQAFPARTEHIITGDFNCRVCKWTYDTAKNIRRKRISIRNTTKRNPSGN